jgi:hypothetical protein
LVIAQTTAKVLKEFCHRFFVTDRGQVLFYFIPYIFGIIEKSLHPKCAFWLQLGQRIFIYFINVNM